MKKILCLCEARHEMPACVEGSVYPQNINPLDLEGLHKQAVKACKGISELTLYVTGLTVALVSVINACNKLGVNLTLMHYNSATGDYYAQKVQ